MRAAVVGAGRIGSFHARNLAKADAVEEIIVVDPLVEHARTLASSLTDALGAHATVSEDLDQVLADGVDMVIVAAPTQLHASVTLRAIDAGVPVFCEKPGATTLEEAAQLVERAEATGVLVQLGFQRRFDPPIRAAAEARARGDIGQLYVARFATHDHEPPDVTYVAPVESLFTETLIHDFDTLRFVTGQDPVRVMSMAGGAGPELTGLASEVRHAGVLLQLEHGAQAVVTASWHGPRGYDVRAELLGSKDSIAVGYGDAPQLRRLDLEGGDDPASDGRLIPGFIERFEHAYREELLAFVDCVRSGQPPACGVRDAYAALAIALAAWESHTSGLPVDVQRLAVPA